MSDEHVGQTTPEEQRARIRECLEYLARNGGYEIAYDATDGLVEDERVARELAKRVAINIRVHANMAGLDVPPVDYPDGVLQRGRNADEAPRISDAVRKATENPGRTVGVEDQA